jgi:hypothetical protein
VTTRRAYTAEWRNAGAQTPASYKCGFCDREVASNQGYAAINNPHLRIYICPFCACPTFAEGNTMHPGAVYGAAVSALPKDVEGLYDEARECVKANAFTAAVLVCRKVLMHLAVDHGAQPGQSFVQYVDHLARTGYVPPNGRAWVDHIRKKGNEATHEIVLMDRLEAERLLTFVEMLLRFIYEFPQKLAPPPASEPSS